MPTKREWLDSVNTTFNKPVSLDPALLRSAAVQFEKLTQQPEWDRFLEKVQARRNEFWTQYESWRDQLEYAKNEERVKECQINCAVFKNCAMALDEIMALP